MHILKIMFHISKKIMYIKNRCSKMNATKHLNEIRIRHTNLFICQQIINSQENELLPFTKPI